MNSDIKKILASKEYNSHVGAKVATNKVITDTINYICISKFN